MSIKKYSMLQHESLQASSKKSKSSQPKEKLKLYQMGKRCSFIYDDKKETVASKE